MCMADGDSRRIGGIVGLGDCWQVEQLAYHIAYLLFASSPIARHRQLDLARSVFSDRESLLCQRLSEEQLARTLGVSRGPIREAFIRLEREGLISSQANRRSIVAHLSQRV